MKTIHVRPCEGGVVRHPETGQPIPAEGVELLLTTQVRRYLRRGDLVEVPAAAPAKAKAKGEKE